MSTTSQDKDHARASHDRARTIVKKAAALEPLEDPHATESPPVALELSAEQKHTLGELAFHSDYEIHHTAKVSGDVAGAFDEQALGAIERAPELGGASRVAQIRALQARHAALTAIAAFLAPLVKLVGQNLLVTDAALAGHVGQVLKVSNGLKSTHAHLPELLANVRRWSSTHHKGHPGHAAPPAEPSAPHT